MASLSQSRALAGCKAFTAVRPTKAKLVSNGAKYFMRRKDSYMVEVQVGEEEPEDIAVRRFMKSVMETRLIEQLRARRYTETKIECAKRRLRERIERNKAGIEDATWEEAYGEDVDPKPFDDFFSCDPDTEFYGGLPLGAQEGGDDFFPGSYTENLSDNKWGSYADQSKQPYQGGGYINQGNQAGGYINQNGGYINQQTPNPNGGYMSPGPNGTQTFTF